MTDRVPLYLRIETFEGEPRLLLTKGSLTFLHQYRGPNIATLLMRTHDIVTKKSWKVVEGMLSKSPRWILVSANNDTIPEPFPSGPSDFYEPTDEEINQFLSLEPPV